jgi:hypothetical protein
MSHIIKWMSDLYAKQIDTNIIDGSKTFKNYINEAVSFPFTRQLGFINLKYSMGMHTSGYVYTTFRSIIKGKSVIYAVVYFRDDEPKFISLSPSYESSKGEFRDSFIEYSALEYVFKHYGKELESIEETIMKALNAGKVDIDYTFYPGSKAIQRDLNMLGIRLMTAATYLIIYKKLYSQIQQHIHKVYIESISSIIDINAYTIKNDKIYHRLFNSGFERPYGQKLTPLSVGEAININDISYPTWRELFLAYATADMVLNGIAPNFPVSANWTYIEGVAESTFDNILIREKFVHNKEVVTLLNGMKDVYKNSEDMVNMEDSRDKIYDSINYITSHKLLSNIAIARIDEFAGLTLTAIPPTVRRAKVVPPHYHQILTNIAYFDKFMFDLMYAAHVLHKRVGAIHLDLHLNNMTIMNVDSSFYKLEGDTYKYQKDKKYSTAFIVDQQQETYIFPFDGYYASIIDFSDSLVSRNFIDYTGKYITHINFDDIIENEKETIFNKLSNSLSYVKRYKDKVKAAIVGKYDQMFKAITALDYVSITRNFRLMCERELDRPKLTSDERDFYIDEKILNRVQYMEEKCLEFLLESVQNVVDDEGKETQFVGDVLLRKFFKKYLYDQQQTKRSDLYEVYRYNADWKSSVALYEDFPIWAKREKVEEKLGKGAAEEMFGMRTVPINMERDIHLAFLIENLSSRYDLDIEQKSSTGREYE